MSCHPVYPACPDLGRDPRRALQASSRDVFSFNPFAFMQLRTLFYPSLREGCARDLSPLLSVCCALFCAMAQSQHLWNQSFAHSFPCNGGVGVLISSSLVHSERGASFFSATSALRKPRSPHLDCSSTARLPRASRGSSQLAFFFCFQRLTHCPICKPFVLITLQQWVGWVGGTEFRLSSFQFRFQAELAYT